MKLIEWTYYRKEYLASQGLRGDFLKRFWAKVTITNTCWLWNRVGPTGHGHIRKGSGGMILAHRASWIIHRGPIPLSLHVLHNCPDGDNPLCVNPSHLWLGTHAQNMADSAKKHQHARGESHPHRKLTESDVIQIRLLWSTGKWSYRLLGEKFGVSSQMASDIVKRKWWQHVP